MTAPNVASRPMTPPRAAAVSGILFSALMIASLVIIRLLVPGDPAKPGIWLTDPAHRKAVRLALYVVPFAGIAFLWFMGVMRSRVGALEDQFLATVFLGSGLLFVSSMFASAATAGALMETARVGNLQLAHETYYFARRIMYTFLNVFAIKMAGVFTFSTCTIVLRTKILPRWVALAGFAFGVALLVIISNWLWIALLFPLWIVLVSAQILLADIERHG